MKVGMYSGGAASHVACMKAKPDALLFADTGEEMPELYDFIYAGAKSLGIPLYIVGIDGGMDACITIHRAIPSSRLPFCSMDLKIKPCMNWLKENAPGATVVIGYTWDEMVRIPKTVVNYEKKGFTCEFPLAGRPYLSKESIIQICKDEGLPIQSLYEKGMNHNNCGGACVKAGISQWTWLYHNDRPRFDKWIEREKRISDIHGKPCSVLKRYKRTYPLTELAQSIQNQEVLPDSEWGGCGCFTGDAL